MRTKSISPLTRTHRRYQRTRLAVLAGEPLCRACRAKGRITPATELDHITPLAASPDRLLDLENLQPLCQLCHRGKTRGDLRGWRGVSRTGDPH